MQPLVHLGSQLWGTGTSRENRTRKGCHLLHHPCRCPQLLGPKGKASLEHYRCTVNASSFSPAKVPHESGLKTGQLLTLAEGGVFLTLLQLWWSGKLNRPTCLGVKELSTPLCSLWGLCLSREERMCFPYEAVTSIVSLFRISQELSEVLVGLFPG